MAELWPKNVCPYMEWLVYLETFWPITWQNINILRCDEVYSISTMKLRILCKFQLNVSKNMDSKAEKPQKCHTICCISICAFCSISITDIAPLPTFFYIFTLNFKLLFGFLNFEFGAISAQFSGKWRQNGAEFDIQKSEQ